MIFIVSYGISYKYLGLITMVTRYQPIGIMCNQCRKLVSKCPYLEEKRMSGIVVSTVCPKFKQESKQHFPLYAS